MVRTQIGTNVTTGKVTDVVQKTMEHSIPLDILSDLLSRFIINVPEPAKENHIRLCFQIELAYWYYLDFYVNNEENDSKLRSCGFKEFAAHVFQHLPYLQSDFNRLSEILEEWREYKLSVPTYGAILLCEGSTHALLVQSYWAKSSWGFPKGKVNEEEDPAHCAIREVYEETGFDISNYINPEHFLEAQINEQVVRLYVITGIPKDTKFQPRTRYEIKACQWFLIADLPNSKKDNTSKVKMGVSANSFYMVLPFIKHIKNLQKGEINKYLLEINKRQRHKSSSFSEGENTNRNKSNGNSESGLGNEGRFKEKRKSHSKRQLFQPEEFVFSAPSWLNFRFDKAAIMECIP